ncbi:MAG: acyltransferase [Rhizomicrobium sp.]
MKKIRRGLSRVFFHIARNLLAPIELVNPRLFMRIYANMLSAYGINFVGSPRYISTKVRFDDFDLLTIGDRSVISKYVILLTHDYSLTTGLIAIGEPPPTDIAIKRKICIGRNVFIGIGAIVLPGTHIGDDVIVGAGSVVKGSIASDSIVSGNPARKIAAISERADRWRSMRDGPDANTDFE